MADIKCKSCGSSVPEATKFCGTCGALVETPAAKARDAGTAEEKKGFDIKNFDFKKYIVPAAGAVVFLIVLIAAVNIFGPSKYTGYSGSVYISQSGDEVVIIPHGKNKIEVEGRLMESWWSLDGKKAAVLINEDGKSSNSDGYTLYLVTGKLQQIADGVHSCWFSAAGNAVAYTKERDTSASISELWLHTGSKATKISKDFYYYNTCVLSPDGKSLGFVTADKDRYTGVVWNGKLNELGRDIVPFAVSNGTKYIYYTKSESFYVQKGFDESKREKMGDDIYSIYANKDMSQVVYNTNERAYINRKGGSREAFTGSLRRFVFPQGTAFTSGNGFTIYNISDFSNVFYVNNDDALVRINNKYESNSVVRNISNVYLADDEKTLIYLRNNRLYKINGKNAKAEPDQLVESGGIDHFLATANGKAVYYLNNDRELFYQKGKSKPVAVTFDNASGLTLFKGKTLFYISDDELYVSNGNKGKLVGGINGNVRSVNAGMLNVAVSANDHGETLVYRSKNGSKFELIIQR